MMVQTVVAPKESRWRRWLVTPVVAQLTVGITPDRLGWTIALGIVLGIFPILGTPTLMCLLAAHSLRLNHPVIQVAKELVYPLHLVLIPVFIRLGERLYGVPLTSFSIPDLLGRFKNDPLQFGMDFGMTACHAVIVWLLIAPFAAILIKWGLTPVMRKLALSIQKRREANG
jgi:uncharacterized protein (DUF2062 family)